MKLQNNQWLLPLISLFLILSLAFFLRAELFFQGDFYYLIDQARDLMLVKDIVIDKNITLIGARSGLGGIFHGPIWLYMLVPTFIFSGGDPFWTLMPVFMFVGLTTIALGFFVTLKLYGKLAAILYGFLLATAFPLIESTISMTNAQVMPMIFLLYLFAIIQYLRKKEWYLALSIILIGIGIHFESAFAVFLIPLTLLAILLRRKIPSIKIVGIGILGAGLVVSNYLLFELRNKFLMTQSIIKLFQAEVEPLKGFERYSDLPFRISERAVSLLKSYIAPFLSSVDILDIIISTCVYLLLLTALIHFVRKYYKSKKLSAIDKEYLFLFLAPIVYFIIFTFYPFPLWPHYTLPLIISTLLLIVVSIKYCNKETLFIISCGVMISFILVPAFYRIGSNYSFNEKYISHSDGSYINQLNTAKAVFENSNGEEFGYLVKHNAVLTYSMDYLLWWLGKTEYGYIPTNTKQSTTFLILYPADSDDRDANEFWKKEVVRTDGEVVLQKDFPGGLMLEKLEIPENDPLVDPNYYHGINFR